MPGLHRILDPAKSVLQTPRLCALGVMTKAPRAGQVKTRLVPPLTQEEAAQLNGCFLRDTADAILRACRKNAIGIGVYTPPGSESDYADILPREFQLLPQRGSDFGQRLAAAAEDLLHCGFDAACLIDSDSPTVRSDDYAKAVDLLSKPGDRVVLGPSDDGGYYLIGLTKMHRQLFEGIDWSTERVCDQTRKRAADLGLEVALLPNNYDVDDRVSLNRLCRELLDDSSPKHLAPYTREFLSDLLSRRTL